MCCYWPLEWWWFEWSLRLATENVGIMRVVIFHLGKPPCTRFWWHRGFNFHELLRYTVYKKNNLILVFHTVGCYRLFKCSCIILLQFSLRVEKLHGGADDIEVSIYIYHTVYKFDNFMVDTGIDGSLFFHVILTPWKSMKGDVVFCLVGCKAYLISYFILHLYPRIVYRVKNYVTKIV